MINYVYQLVNPQFFSIKFENVDLKSKVLVRPRFMSICQADQRYYLGNREINKLNEKLPMALIHECCGEVVFDKTGTYKPGQNVVMVPNTLSNGEPLKDYMLENYVEGSYFLSSGYDGFMREFVDISPDRLVPFENIPLQTAAITEFFSVACQAVSRFDKFAHSTRETITIWGDGSLAYVLACVLREKFPKSQLVVIGKNERKLSRFSFVNQTYLNYELPDNFKTDHAFECVGGESCYDAIDHIITHIRPQGVVMLLGVSENKIAIDTRLMLEKGLTMIGCSRSGKADFEEAVNLMKTQKVIRRLSSIIYEDSPVHNIDDIHRVFATDLNTPFKTVFEWKL
ncbi:MAG: alcohol dehydrogenase catalytic domain-containing protein [Bacillota bacterium]|nr:alcohol dehydrogenase catalytic domain-containing protein [Bacillota bacterium]